MDHEAIEPRCEPIDYADETELASDHEHDLPPQPGVPSPTRSPLVSLPPAPVHHIPPQAQPLLDPQVPPLRSLPPVSGPRHPPTPAAMHHMPAQRASPKRRTIEAVDVSVASPVQDRAQYASEVANDGLTTLRKRRMLSDDSSVAPQPLEDSQSSVEQRHILTAEDTQQPDPESHRSSSVPDAQSSRVSKIPCRICSKEV
jgi:hypothetical protein